MELSPEVIERCGQLTLSLVLNQWGNLSYTEVYEAIEKYAETEDDGDMEGLRFLDIYDDLSATDPYFIMETMDNIYYSLVEVAKFAKEN